MKLLRPAAILATLATPALAQTPKPPLPMDQVYQGPIHLPDFTHRDRQFAGFRTRIRQQMSTGPDFAGHYAIIQIGCGAGCTFNLIADVATGQIFDFPYSGEDYQAVQIIRSPKSPGLKVIWIANEQCHQDHLTWTGNTFTPRSPTTLGPEDLCTRL